MVELKNIGPGAPDFEHLRDAVPREQPKKGVKKIKLGGDFSSDEFIKLDAGNTGKTILVNNHLNEDHLHASIRQNRDKSFTVTVNGQEGQSVSKTVKFAEDVFNVELNLEKNNEGNFTLIKV